MGNITQRFWTFSESIGHRLPILSDELVADGRYDSDVLSPSEWVSAFAEDFRIAIAFAETRLLNIIKKLKPRGTIVREKGLERMICESTPIFMSSEEIEQLRQLTGAARGDTVNRSKLVGVLVGAFADIAHDEKGLALKEDENGNLVFVFNERAEPYY